MPIAYTFKVMAEWIVAMIKLLVIIAAALMATEARVGEKPMAWLILSFEGLNWTNDSVIGRQVGTDLPRSSTLELWH